MDFELSVRARDQCVVVRIDGECDAGSTAALRESLLGVLAANPARVVLDLSGLDFLDCAGARVLVAVGRRATLLGGTLAVAALTDPVARLLQVTGLGARLAVFPAVDAALAAVRPA
ncbi:MAG TPA: STAS domain-containing protein, partial [Trebonia sp.]